MLGGYVDPSAKINARIRHLAESKSAAFEHAHAPARPAAVEHSPAEELFSREIPEGQAIVVEIRESPRKPADHDPEM